MTPIIRFQNLTKKFGNVAAVDHLTMDIEEGEILGLLGPARAKDYRQRARVAAGAITAVVRAGAGL